MTHADCLQENCSRIFLKTDLYVQFGNSLASFPCYMQYDLMNVHPILYNAILCIVELLSVGSCQPNNRCGYETTFHRFINTQFVHNFIFPMSIEKDTAWAAVQNTPEVQGNRRQDFFSRNRILVSRMTIYGMEQTEPTCNRCVLYVHVSSFSGICFDIITVISIQLLFLDCFCLAIFSNLK